MSQETRPIGEFERAVPAGRRPVPAGTVWFVSRHPGAVEWATRQGLAVDCWIAHLDVGEVRAGDTVIGTLPVNLAAAVCRRGARYLNLTLDLPESARGRELTAGELEHHGAFLESYFVRHEPCVGAGKQFAGAVHGRPLSE